MEFLTLVLFIIGFILLISGAEFLVRGASALAIAVGISPLVVGLTVVAFGTSAPELAVTIQATYAGQADLGIGNIVGSNISNILLVLGLAALFGNLLVPKQLVKLELPLLVVISVAVWFLGSDGLISNFEGVLLVAAGLGYVVYTVRKSRQQTKAERAAANDVEVEVAKIHSPVQILRQVALIVLGLGTLVLGSRWLIDGAVQLARLLGVSELVIGLTVIAVGTSLPEIATSVVAVMRNKRDIAVGNAVGSNVFNLLIVLGIASAVSPAGIPVSTWALKFDIPIMTLVAVISIPVFYTHYRIDRAEGAVFVVYYATYIIYLFLAATGSLLLPTFRTFVLMGILPVTLLVIFFRLFRCFSASRNNRTTLFQAPPSQN